MGVKEWAELADWLKHMQEVNAPLAHVPEMASHIEKLKYWESIVRSDGGTLPRQMTDPCPYPDEPWWTVQDCFNAKRCSCADGVRLGYRPTTIPLQQTPGEVT